MIKDTSGYDSFDQLNRQAAVASGGQSPVRPSRFTSAINSINAFLGAATDTIVTVDGVINRPANNVTQPSVYPPMTDIGRSTSSVLPYVALAGVAIGGSMLAMNVFSRRR
jgi:hypothetical protein